MPKRLTKKVQRRSAISGKYITKKYADKRPKITVTETDKKKKKYMGS
jgi:hypothetical protein